MEQPKPMTELTRIRQERALSQQGLADASGVNKATINQIERGRRSPNVETLGKLAAALGVEVADFFPKAQASLPLEPVQRSGDRNSGPAPSRYYTAFEAFGQALAFAWAEDLAEWNEKVPDGEWASSFDFARMVQWTLEIAGTKAVYKAVGELEAPPRAELTHTLRHLDEASQAATDKVLRVFEPVKTFKEFQKIWEASDMDAVVSDAPRR